MNDRIKLAEAMNLLPDDFQGWGEYKDSIEKYGGEVLRILLALIPDPFTDANDDYAVLEWMRDSDKYEAFEKKCVRYVKRYIWNYEIGDNARAALKVIDRAPSEVQTEDVA